MERNHIEYKIKIQEVSEWKKEGYIESKISNFWIIIIDNGVTETSFRVNSKSELLRRLKEELSLVKVKR
jgi:beta-glucanase (GH16 family)